MTNEGWSVASVLWRSLGSLSPITPDPSTFFKPQGWLQVTSQWNNSYTMAITVLFHTSSHCGWIVVVDLEDLWAASNKTRNLLNSCILSKWITLISNFFLQVVKKTNLTIICQSLPQIYKKHYFCYQWIGGVYASREKVAFFTHCPPPSEPVIRVMSRGLTHCSSATSVM